MANQEVPSAMNEAETKAVANSLRISPQKLNLLAQLIRGMSAERAMNELTFSRKRISKAVKDLLGSAIANAENNHMMDVDALYVKEAYVGKALVMKRFHVRGRGRSSRILKPYANLTIVLGERKELN